MNFNRASGNNSIALQIAFALVFITGISVFSYMRADKGPKLAKEAAIINEGDNKEFTASSVMPDKAEFEAAAEAVIPVSGHKSKIVFKDIVLKLVQSGGIDRLKFEDIYATRGGAPKEVAALLRSPSDERIFINRENANAYLNVLWPLGLANYMKVNEASPVNGKDLMNFASTGGWTLGKEENGGAYFNKFKIVPLTSEQETLVKRVAENTYRPCCGNSTFFQDCNHGSALLGLLELGASQGLTEDELFREALAFNSFWFPDTYIQTAVYFKAAKGIEWRDIDPKTVMGQDYSSGLGWYENVRKENERLGLVPEEKGGASCGV